MKISDAILTLRLHTKTNSLLEAVDVVKAQGGVKALPPKVQKAYIAVYPSARHEIK